MKHLPFFLTGFLFMLVSCQDEKPDTNSWNYKSHEYTVYFGDEERGFFKSTHNGNNTHQYEWKYNDRGRGPHLTETIITDNDGYLTGITVKGINYLKDSVDESFSKNGQTAEWQSTSEKGSSEATNAQYIGVNSGFGNMEVILKKMIENDLKEINTYPSGKIILNNVAEHTFYDTLNLKLVTYSGLGFTPELIWLDQNNQFFAYPSDWASFIRNGYKDLNEELLEITKKARNEYYNDQAKALTTTPDGKIIITNVRVFNSESKEVNNDKTVIIEGNKISQILDSSDDFDSEGTIIDGKGRMLMPGLIDMHGHLNRAQGLMNIAAGVTSVRDMANGFDLPEVADDFNSNAVIGPRILIMSGFIDKTGPYAGPLGKKVSTIEEALEAVDFYEDRGYQQIKLYSSIEPEWVKPIAERVHSYGMKLSGHIPSFMLAEEAIKDGYDEIQHVNMLALNFLGDTIDTRTPQRFIMVGKHAYNIDIESNEFQEFLKLMKDNDIVSDPTVSIFEGMLTSKAGTPNPSFAMILDRLPIQVKRGFMTGGLPIPEGMEGKYKESYQRLLDIVKAMYDYGITIVPGTDSMVGFGLHTELENYVRAGIPADEVLKMATYTSANVCKRDDLGQIKKGMLADVILVNGDPTQNIKDIRNVDLTIKDGKIYDAEKLYSSIGIKHYN
ncbi:amidohydrolase family protein [Marinigracilibium pacificum]|uniref:Amidohydrolase family protein n=1 Tax=Marinigracilibium pacificum TaxID=2729599 RepID=A0A848J0I9_9BACT|nr:amidohydrolase family protein [Marinigracilibium pacificum]NMM47789.1 amidohydrolase family protein [Marinigracilibium pacificum]